MREALYFADGVLDLTEQRLTIFIDHGLEETHGACPKHGRDQVREARKVIAAALSTKQEGEDNIPPEEDDRMSPHLTGGGTLRRSAVPDEGCDPAYGSWFVAAPSSPVSPTPEERDAVLEEAATVCDRLTKLYRANVAWDSGYSHGAQRCASEIRALKHPADVAGDEQGDGK